jgi:hypothetical protein
MRAVCVTGMHRSGTSFAARALDLLGVSLGDPDRLLPPGPDNPAGYWENRDVQELDDEVLARLGGSWDQPPVLDPGWEHDPGLNPFRGRAKEILDQAFSTIEAGSLICWKDPRLSLLLPFWRTVVTIRTTIVLVRGPAEVAASLRTRNRIEAPQAAMLWLRYLYAATSVDTGHLLLRHCDFFDDLPRTLAAMARHLDLPLPKASVEGAVRDHLDPSLRHYVTDEADIDGSNPLVALAAAVWNDGDVDLGALPPVVADGIGRGWLRPAIDGELLARARGEAIRARQQLRKRKRQLAELQTRHAE